jgi:hypothetical protein
MLERFIRRLSGAISPAVAEHYCEECLSNLPVIARSRFPESEPFLDILKDARFGENLLGFLKGVCAKCFTTRRRSVQLLNLRRELLARADELFIAEVYLAMTDADRRIVCERLFSQRTKTENDAHFLASRAFNYAATLVLRDLAREHFKDMRPGDWYDAYVAAGRDLVQTSLGTLVGGSTASSRPGIARLPALEARTKEIRGIALSGKNLLPEERPVFAGES